MAQLNQPNMKTKSEASERFSSRHLPMVFAGLLTVALFVGVSSCSKKNTPVAAVPNQPAMRNQPAAPTPAAATPQKLPPSAATAPKKKARKRRPATATGINKTTCVDKTNGVSLTYPRPREHLHRRSNFHDFEGLKIPMTEAGIALRGSSVT
jgi:hypothetical protein